MPKDINWKNNLKKNYLRPGHLLSDQQKER